MMNDDEFRVFQTIYPPKIQGIAIGWDPGIRHKGRDVFTTVLGAKDVRTQRDRLEIGTQLANAERRQGRDPYELFHSRGATEETGLQGGT